MNKVLLIIKREYLAKVRKRSFMIMTFLGPLFFTFVMVVPIWITTRSEENRVIEVLDESNYFLYRLPNSGHITFAYFNGTLGQSRQNFVKTDHDALLFIPKYVNLQNPKGITLFSRTIPSPEIKAYIEKTLNEEIFKMRLENSGIDTLSISRLKTDIAVDYEPIVEEWEDETAVKAAAGAGLFSAILIYFFIFLYGVQVMRGIMEEKSNRIVEVIISSVKPFQLMMGKIVGIALVSLTQFFIWLGLTFGMSTLFTSHYAPALDRFSNQHIQNTISQPNMDVQQAMEINHLMNSFGSIDFGILICSFVFYFLAGYLLYSSMFAAIGSAVDAETDIQQFMLPVTLPLITSFVAITTIMENPDGQLALWMSMIPFTSPIIMMVRIPFGVNMYEVAISMLILITTFIFFTWVASRIYRVGILMYGKKITYGEIIKWLFYKQ